MTSGPLDLSEVLIQVTMGGQLASKSIIGSLPFRLVATMNLKSVLDIYSDRKEIISDKIVISGEYKNGSRLEKIRI